MQLKRNVQVIFLALGKFGQVDILTQSQAAEESSWKTAMTETIWDVLGWPGVFDFLVVGLGFSQLFNQFFHII